MLVLRARDARRRQKRGREGSRAGARMESHHRPPLRGRIIRVSGNGNHLTATLPVGLDAGRMNVVAIRAENVLGLTSRADRTVERLP